MVQQTDRKDGLFRAVPTGSTARRCGLTIVILVVAAVMMAGLGGAASVESGNTNATIESPGPAVDIVIVFDRSLSTNEDRYHFAQEVDRLNGRFENSGIDTRYGLVTYNGTDRIDLSLTSDFDSFEKAMHFTEGGDVENASHAILTATSMDFRNDSEKVVVVVTDEDDDSSNETRNSAMSSLSGFHFIAVSPSSPGESSCSVHSPPCDNMSHNELRTIADQVDGGWIGEGHPSAAIIDGIADAVESRVDIETGEMSTYRPEFTTIDHSANRTSAEVGDWIRFSKTVENVGMADGTYEAYLSHGGTIIAAQTVSIPAGESQTIAFVHQFEDPGEYDVLITHEWITTVIVTEPTIESTETGQTETPPATESPTPTQMENSLPGFGFGVALAALAGVALLVFRRE